MTSDYTFTTLTNTDPDFYPTLGPFLANRAVIKQLGDTPHDDDGKTWIVARHDGAVAGFIVYWALKSGIVRTESCYTAPDYDDLRPRLIAKVIDAVDEDATIAATARADYLDYYLDLGFIETPSRYVNFRQLRRTPAPRP